MSVVETLMVYANQERIDEALVAAVTAQQAAAQAVTASGVSVQARDDVQVAATATDQARAEAVLAAAGITELAQGVSYEDLSDWAEVTGPVDPETGQILTPVEGHSADYSEKRFLQFVMQLLGSGGGRLLDFARSATLDLDDGAVTLMEGVRVGLDGDGAYLAGDGGALKLRLRDNRLIWPDGGYDEWVESTDWLWAVTDQSTGNVLYGMRADGTLAGLGGETDALIYNPNSAGRRQLRKVLADVRLGRGSRILACVGDSKVAGYGASNPRVGNAWPALLGQQIAARDPSLKPASASVFGTGGTPTDLATFNAQVAPLVVGAGGWLPSGTQLGGAFMANSADAGELTYTPGIACDTIEFWWPRNSGYGTVEWSLNGGAWTAVSQAGTAGYQRTVITAGSVASNHVLRIRRASGTVYWGGFAAYDSTRSNLLVHNLGHGGTTSGSWSSAGSYKVLGLAALAPAHTILLLGTNDANTQPGWMVPGGQFETQMSAIITQAKASGGCTLIGPSPMGTAGISQDMQDAILAAVKRLCVQHDISAVLFRSLLGSYAELSALGAMNDNLHENEIGYAIEAGALLGYALG